MPSSVDSIRGWWDKLTVLVILDAKRRLTVLASLASVEPGDRFVAEFDPDEDAIVFRRIGKNPD
jgi:hypothetical protein